MGNSREAYEWAAGAEDRFAKRMRELRENKKVSQADLAKVMTKFGFKMHQSSIAKLERDEDRRPLRLGEALMLAYILGEELDSMLYGPLGAAEPEIEGLAENIRQAEEEIYGQLEAYKKLKDDYQDKLSTRMRLLREQVADANRLKQVDDELKKNLLVPTEFVSFEENLDW